LDNAFYVDKVRGFWLKVLSQRLRELSGAERRFLKWAVLNMRRPRRVSPRILASQSLNSFSEDSPSRWIEPPSALRKLLKYWEIIADNLSKAGWTWGCVATIDSIGRTIFVADAHRDDGKRFVVRSEEKLAVFLELERITRKTTAPLSVTLDLCATSHPSRSQRRFF
jgi:hypothetical protein